MSEKVEFEIYLDVEGEEITIGLTAYISSWPREMPEMEGSTCVYPGCDAGSQVEDVWITANPDAESIVRAVDILSGDESTELYQNGVTFALDRYKGIAVDSFDADEVHDYLLAHYV